MAEFYFDHDVSFAQQRGSFLPGAQPAIPIPFSASKRQASSSPTSGSHDQKRQQRHEPRIRFPVDSVIVPTIPYRLADTFGVEKLVPRYRHEGRSGYSPVNVRLKTDEPMTSRERRHAREDIGYQAISLAPQFHTEQLLRFGAIEMFDAMPSDLNSVNAPIHPIFDRNCWKMTSDLPRNPNNNDRFGATWCAWEDDIWAVMQPSLRLASLLLSNSHLFPWWDALVFGTFETIFTFKNANGELKHLRKFSQRDPKLQEQDAGKTKIAFAKLQKVLTWYFYDPETDEDYAYGITMPHKDKKRITIQIAYFFAEILLRKDLTVSQRLMYQFFCAILLVHELCHAVYKHRNMKSGEPFWEDESVAELGNSWENVTFGGRIIMLPEAGRSMHSIAVCAVTWPNIFQHPPFMVVQDSAWGLRPNWRPDRNNPKDFREEFWPIPVTYMSAIQQSAFWEHFVPRFGRSAIVHFTKIRGYAYMLTEDFQKLPVNIFGEMHNFWRAIAKQDRPYDRVPYPSASHNVPWIPGDDMNNIAVEWIEQAAPFMWRDYEAITNFQDIWSRIEGEVDVPDDPYPEFDDDSAYAEIESLSSETSSGRMNVGSGAPAGGESETARSDTSGLNEEARRVVEDISRILHETNFGSRGSPSRRRKPWWRH